MESILEFIRDNGGPGALVLLFLGAALEYMVPPLPADLVVLSGSLLVLAGKWSLLTVFVVAVAGGLLGSFIHYQLGRVLLAGKDGNLRGSRWVERLTGKGSIERFFAIFRRYGVWVIAVNRMFPGIRSVTFLAAGAARLPIVPTMLLGLVSNIIWTLVLLFLGLSLGGNWEKIEAAFAVYSKGAAIVTAIIVVAFLVVRKVRKRRVRL